MLIFNYVKMLLYSTFESIVRYDNAGQSMMDYMDNIAVQMDHTLASLNTQTTGNVNHITATKYPFITYTLIIFRFKIVHVERVFYI